MCDVCLCVRVCMRTRNVFCMNPNFHTSTCTCMFFTYIYMYTSSLLPSPSLHIPTSPSLHLSPHLTSLTPPPPLPHRAELGGHTVPDAEGQGCAGRLQLHLCSERDPCVRGRDGHERQDCTLPPQQVRAQGVGG